MATIPMRTNTLGIIAEFNPFHSGHSFLFQKAKEISGADEIVCVMSGNFIQRGGPAVFDKWERAKNAVENGADLVLELPTVFASASAGYFAKGGVEVLEGLGAVDALCFGSESGDIDKLTQAAKTMKMVEENRGGEIRTLLKEGMSYPRARQEIFQEAFHDGDIAKEPNNILALEYLMISQLPAFAVKRDGEGHLESAAKVRAKLFAEDPERFLRMESRYFDMVRTAIIRSDAEELEKIASAGEGLGNKLKKDIRYADSLSALVKRSRSKRYTETRISRLLAQLVLGVDGEVLRRAKPYLKPLAFNEKGAAIIRDVKNKELNTIPFVDSYGKTFEKGDKDLSLTLEKDILATDLYNIITGRDLYQEADQVRKPERVGL